MHKPGVRQIRHISVKNRDVRDRVPFGEGVQGKLSTMENLYDPACNGAAKQKGLPSGLVPAQPSAVAQYK